MNNLFVENGFVSLNKNGESICGDFHTVVRNGKTTTTVLSDGLGSGVKANILATLTSKILSTLMAGNLSIEDCIYTMATTLPICKVRKMAYSTFTILQIDSMNIAYIAQFDNPTAIILRKGKYLDYPSSRKVIGDKEIYESHISLQKDDMIFLMTDGVTNCGLGKTTNRGWARQDIIKFLEKWYTPEISPQRMALALSRACLDLYLNEPDDDTTILAYKLRERQAVNMLVGPPENKEDDQKVMHLFFSKEGKKVICGGTTANTVSKYLGKPIEIDLSNESADVPATAKIEGVDLVTEGVITLGKLADLAKKCFEDNNVITTLQDKKDAVSMLAKMLFEQATDINIYFGQAVNPAHQEDGMTIDFNEKMMIIKTLEKYLTKMDKKVKISMC
ncbi:MAG: SpoIIE family protein phosphatase [Oscillospiraceae bacterium]